MTGSADRGPDDRLRVYLIGVTKYDLLDGREQLPWKHVPADHLEEAEAVFLWLEIEPTTDMIFALGAARSLGIPIYVGAKHPRFQDLLPTALRKLVGGIHGSARAAYRTVLADADLTARRVSAHESPVPGRCKACHGSYRVGDRVMVRPRFGALHVDCYERQRAPGAPQLALFNAELISALREENARLEKELGLAQYVVSTLTLPKPA